MGFVLEQIQSDNLFTVCLFRRENRSVVATLGHNNRAGFSVLCERKKAYIELFTMVFVLAQRLSGTETQS